MAAKPEMPHAAGHFLGRGLEAGWGWIGDRLHFKLEQSSVPEIAEWGGAGGIGAVGYHGDLPKTDLLGNSLHSVIAPFQPA
jgi:hypothetical protein